MTVPVTTELDLTAVGSSTAVKEILEAKYADSGNWAQYAASIVESKLTAINTSTEQFDITSFIDAATAAITAIPDPPAMSAIDFTAPLLRGTFATLPTPTTHTAGTAPDTSITFTNGDFTDTLLTALRTKLEADITTASTGLGSAETDLFDRETARQNAARSKAYDEVTTQFSARGFDMPPGALLAKQTEMNNESNIRLSDSSSQVMAESARLAQEWNKATLSASTQLLDVLSKVFDSKVMRDFEAAKNSVLLSVEGFKASIAEVTAAADLEARHIQAVATGNSDLSQMLAAESAAQGAYVQAQGQRNAAEAAGYDVTSRKALGIAGLSKDMALSNIDAATRKYLGDINVLESASQSASQLVAAALNGINFNATLGFRGAATAGITNNTTDSYGKLGKDDVADHANPTLPRL